ncbi:MAG: hypothetical protein NZ951_06135 [Dehalococcoidia bacterium]|nr:hypothetical protein [Dehalococcoidia bacterium]MDW8119970.1 FmdB family zinc ribbon protein [Chloroflexota bacterium]
MPIYEYVCESRACSHHFELRQSFDAEPIATCPVCNGRARRRISPVPIIFRGSGWYVTDYARKNPTLSSSEESSKPSNGASGTAEASKADTAPSAAKT